MAAISKPVIWSLALVCVGAVLFLLNDNSPAAVKVAAVAGKSHKKEQPTFSLLSPTDFTARFSRAHLQVRNLFFHPETNAFIGRIPLPDANRSIVKVPAVLAGGDGNWIFTGIAVVDGKKMALLENSSKHLAEYALEGSPWKASKVLRISADGVAFIPKDGGPEQVVLRYNPSLEAPALPPAGPPPNPALAGNQPVSPPGLSGPIGNPNMQIRRMRGFPSNIVIQNGNP